MSYRAVKWSALVGVSTIRSEYKTISRSLSGSHLIFSPLPQVNVR